MLCSVLNAFVDKATIDPSRFQLPSTLPNFNETALHLSSKKASKVSKVHSLSLDDILLLEESADHATRTPDNVRLSILLTTLKMMHAYLTNCSHFTLLNGTAALFNDAKLLLQSLPKSLPKQISMQATATIQLIDTQLRSITWKALRMHDKTQLTIPKMFEPEFDEVYTGKRRNKEASLAKREESRMKHLLKQERKGAEREIRLDAHYLARKKAQKTKLNDEDRMQKTKQLMGFLETQQHDANVVRRGKKQKTSAF